jgi:hypothetical protein
MSRNEPLSGNDAGQYFEAMIASILASAMIQTNHQTTPVTHALVIKTYKDMIQGIRSAGGAFK